MAVAISSGVRNALASLSSVAHQSQVAQNRLATGKKVNTATDNAVNFFSANALNDRSSQLSALLDGMSNGVQTINAASKGIDSITTLVKSLQSTIKQAQNEAASNRPYTLGTVAIGGGAVGNKTAKDVALDTVLVGTAAAATATTDGVLGLSTNAALSISSNGSTYQVSFSSGATVRDLVNEINKSGLATAAIDENGKLSITGNGSNKVYVGVGDGASASAAVTNASSATNKNTLIGLTAAMGDTATPGAGITAASTANSAVRASLISQFNSLTQQIDQVAKDSSFAGTNLLNGDKLSIVFNEKTGTNQSKLDVQQGKVNAANLGILQAANSAGAGQFNIQDDTALNTAADTLTNALSALRSMSSSLGANLAVVQARQDFTKSMVQTLTTGADNLVNADGNEEAATLLSLQTRQQLSQTALSLSNQADQGILRVF